MEFLTNCSINMQPLLAEQIIFFKVKLSHALLPLGNIQTLKQFFKHHLSPLDLFLKFNYIDFYTHKTLLFCVI